MSNKNDAQLQQLQQENTILKAQVYDLNVALQNMQANTQGVFKQIVDALDIDVPSEGMAIEQVIAHIRALTSPEMASSDKE